MNSNCGLSRVLMSLKTARATPLLKAPYRCLLILLIGLSADLTHRLNVKVKDLLHEGGQLGHERFVSVVLTHVGDEDGPERHRREDRLPGHRWRLWIIEHIRSISHTAQTIALDFHKTLCNLVPEVRCPATANCDSMSLKQQWHSSLIVADN